MAAKSCLDVFPQSLDTYSLKAYVCLMHDRTCLNPRPAAGMRKPSPRGLLAPIASMHFGSATVSLLWQLKPRPFLEAAKGNRSIGHKCKLSFLDKLSRFRSSAFFCRLKELCVGRSFHNVITSVLLFLSSNVRRSYSHGGVTAAGKKRWQAFLEWFLLCPSAAPVYQMTVYYQDGVVDSCTQKWSELYDCLKLKTRTRVEQEVSASSRPLCCHSFACFQTHELRG